MILLADREGPDQTARKRRLIRTLAARTHFHMARLINKEASITLLRLFSIFHMHVLSIFGSCHA